MVTLVAPNAIANWSGLTVQPVISSGSIGITSGTVQIVSGVVQAYISGVVTISGSVVIVGSSGYAIPQVTSGTSINTASGWIHGALIVAPAINEPVKITRVSGQASALSVDNRGALYTAGTKYDGDVNVAKSSGQGDPPVTNIWGGLMVANGQSVVTRTSGSTGGHLNFQYTANSGGDRLSSGECHMVWVQHRGQGQSSVVYIGASGAGTSPHTGYGFLLSSGFGVNMPVPFYIDNLNKINVISVSSGAILNWVAFR